MSEVTKQLRLQEWARQVDDWQARVWIIYRLRIPSTPPYVDKRKKRRHMPPPL